MADKKISELTELDATPAVGDFLAIVDTDASATKKISVANLMAAEAGDIEGVTAGTAMSGGGTTGTVTLNVDVNGASVVTAVAADYVLVEDIGDNTTKKALISDITALAGDIEGVTAGTNLSGGGTTGTVTLNVAIDAALDVGSDGSGVDLTLHSGAAGDFVLWDASDKSLEFTDSTVAMQDNAITRPEITDYSETVNVIGGTGGGTQDIDVQLGNVVTATVDTSENTFTFSDPSASGKACSFTLILTNGGSQTVNWPATVDWAASTAPTLTASGVDVLTFLTVDGGSIWYGFAGGLDMG